MCFLCFFFFKQRTAYELRISDWSSDVCSSDLPSLSMAEAARISGLNRPSTGRCLFTLVRLGYVRKRGGRYMLTPGLLPLACGFLTSTPLASASQAIANALRDRLQEIGRATGWEQVCESVED